MAAISYGAKGLPQLSAQLLNALLFIASINTMLRLHVLKLKPL